MKKQKRILIVRPDRIGDVVLSTPIPREIKKTYPDSFVALFLRKYTEVVYENNPYVDKVILIDDDDGSQKAFWKKVKEIRSYKFTHSLTLLPTERINYLLFFAGIPFRVGVGHKFYQFATFTRYVSRNKYIPLRHEADYCMDLARRIGVVTDNLETQIFLSEEEKAEASKIRLQLLNSKKYIIGIHTTNGNSAPNWIQKRYRELIEKLLEVPGLVIVLTDKDPSDALRNIPNVIYPAGYNSLRSTIVNLSVLDLLISSSTGPMHMCAALKVRTLSLFCPLPACSPKLWGPFGNENMIVQPSENYCSNLCPGDPKKCSFEGEGGISTDLVFSEIKKFLGI